MRSPLTSTAEIASLSLDMSKKRISFFLIGLFFLNAAFGENGLLIYCLHDDRDGHFVGARQDSDECCHPSSGRTSPTVSESTECFECVDFEFKGTDLPCERVSGPKLPPPATPTLLHANAVPISLSGLHSVILNGPQAPPLAEPTPIRVVRTIVFRI